MQIEAKEFIDNVKFKDELLDESSILFFQLLTKEARLEKILNVVLYYPIYNYFSFTEIIHFLEFLETNYFKDLSKTTQFKMYNLFVLSKWQTDEIYTALKIIKKIENEYYSISKELFANTLNFKGGINQQLGKLDEAISNFYLGLEQLEDLEQEEIYGIHIALNNNIAYIYTEQKEFEGALQIYLQNLEREKILNDSNSMAITCLNIAEIHLEQKDFKTSLLWLLKAENYKLEIGSRNFESKIELKLATNYLYLENYESAKKYIKNYLKSKNLKDNYLAHDLSLQVFLKENKEGNVNSSTKENILERTSFLLRKIDELYDTTTVIRSYNTIISAYEFIGDFKKANEISKKKFSFYSQKVEKQKVESYKQIRINSEIQQQERELEKKEHQNKLLSLQNEELEQFTYMASHDLKSPLRNIIAFSNLMNDADISKEDMQQYAGLVANNAKKMNTLIVSLLKYSKIGFDKVKMTDVSLIDAMDSATENIQDEMEGKHLALNYGDLPQIKGNRFLLIQLFQNLLGNALKYNNNNRIQIDITSKEKDDALIIEIKDNGIGIPANKIGEIFKAFSRAHSETIYEGTGIGLATCQKIMKIHAGEISVTSKENEGSTFKLKFNLPTQ